MFYLPASDGNTYLDLCGLRGLGTSYDKHTSIYAIGTSYDANRIKKSKILTPQSVQVYLIHS